MKFGENLYNLRKAAKMSQEKLAEKMDVTRQFGRKNKDKIIRDLQVKTSLSEDDAENVYDISMKIITGEIKNKIKHPFKSQN